VKTPIVPILAVAVAAGGCAKKSFVLREVAEVNRKVDAVSSDVERTQERVRQNETRIEAVDQSARSGISEAERAARGKLLYTVTLSSDKVLFPVNEADISAEAKAKIDEAVVPLVEANRGVYLEIEGHTDSTGDAKYNRWLGEERARAVRDYIARTYAVALSRLSLISYGEEKPVVDNKTRDDRAQNRRVVIRVLE
jgi:peptidoglycan-associated lipoprotein